MADGDNVAKTTGKYDTLKGLIAEMYEARTRSQKWDFLYATEYEGESVELNEAMAAMTDSAVDKWFIQIATEFIAKKVGVL